MHSVVLRPMARCGRRRAMRCSWAVRETRASTEAAIPGAITPPMKLPAAETTSKLVDVPKSATTAGAP